MNTAQQQPKAPPKPPAPPKPKAPPKPPAQQQEDIKNYIELAIDLTSYAMYQRAIKMAQPTIRKLTRYTEDKPNVKKIICSLLNLFVEHIKIEEIIPE
jgi:hypothetical protein